MPESIADPLGYYHNNTVKSRALIAAAVEAGGTGDQGERAHPVLGAGELPVLPDAGNAERLAVLHGDGIGCLALAPLIAFHSKKLSIGTMQRRSL